MRKIILMSGLATMITASFNGNAKAIIVTDKGVINSANIIANTGVPMVVQDSMALKAVHAFFDKFKSGASPEELANFFDEKAEMFIPGDMKNVPWIGKRVGRAAITEHFKLLRENIKPEKLPTAPFVSQGFCYAEPYAAITPGNHGYFVF
jgi:hypothetical protein